MYPNPRPRLNVLSENLLFVSNVPTAYDWFGWKKAYRRSFGAWNENNQQLPYVLIDFIARPNLERFRNVVNKGRFPRSEFPNGVSMSSIHPGNMVDRAKFFNMVMSLTGVDLVANNGIPPSPSRRSTAIPRRSNQTRVALGLREETVLPSSVSSGYSTLSSPTSTSNSNNLVYQPRIGLQRYCATSKTNEFEAAINERNEFGNDGNEEQENLRRSAASSETALADDLPEYPEDVHNVDGECDDISAYMDTAIMSPNDYSEQSRPQTLAEAGEDTAASNYDYDQDQNDDDGWSVQCGFNDDEELNVSDQGSVEEMHVLSFHGLSPGFDYRKVMLLLNTCKKEGLLRTAIPNGSTFQLCFSSEFHLNNFSLMELDDKFVEALREKFGPNVETKLTKEFYKLD